MKMSILDYQSIMLPLRKQISEGQAHKFAEAKENLAQEFKLTPQERRELLPSGSQAIFDNRVAWARTYLGRQICCTGHKEENYNAKIQLIF